MNMHPLMGIPDYNFGDATDNQVRFGFGDAVAVPVVAWLGKELPHALGSSRIQPGFLITESSCSWLVLASPRTVHRIQKSSHR